MKFHIDQDQGTVIQGWVAPDNPGATALLCIIVPGRDPIEVAANMPRPDVCEVGLHGTGNVGFVIDASLVEDLEHQTQLEIVEPHSGVQIYRRNDPAMYVQRRVLYIDTSLMPQNKVHRALYSAFAIRHPFVERFALDTMTGLIDAVFVESCIMVGRPYLARHFAHLKHRQFFISVVLNDPYEELAERLLFIQLLSKSNAAHVTPTFTTGVEGLVDFARNLSLEDSRMLAQAFRSANENVKAQVANPMTRICACNPGESPEQRHVTTALDILSTVDVVGIRRRFSEFGTVFGGLLGRNILGAQSVYASDAVGELASKLAKIGAVQRLLELDAALYSYAEDAMETGLSAQLDHG